MANIRRTQISSRLPEPKNVEDKETRLYLNSLVRDVEKSLKRLSRRINDEEVMAEELKLEFFANIDIDTSTQSIDGIENNTSGILYISARHGDRAVLQEVPYNMQTSTLVLGSQTQKVLVSTTPLSSVQASGDLLVVNFTEDDNNRLHVGYIKLVS